MNLIQLTLLVILVPRRYIEEETRFPGINFYICQFSLLIITESREGKHSFWNSYNYSRCEIQVVIVSLNYKENQLDSSKSNLIEQIHPDLHNSSDFDSGTTAEILISILKGINLTAPFFSPPTSYDIWCYSTDETISTVPESSNK